MAESNSVTKIHNIPVAEEDLKCPICINEFEDPKALPNCLHSVCEECLEEIASRSNEQFLECPICRVKSKLPLGGVDKLPTNHLVKTLVNAIPGRKEKLELKKILRQCEDKVTGWKSDLKKFNNSIENLKRFQQNTQDVKKEIVDHTKYVLNVIYKECNNLCRQLDKLKHEQDIHISTQSELKQGLSKLIDQTNGTILNLKAILERNEPQELIENKEKIVNEAEKLRYQQTFGNDVLGFLNGDNCPKCVEYKKAKENINEVKILGCLEVKRTGVLPKKLSKTEIGRRISVPEVMLQDSSISRMVSTAATSTKAATKTTISSSTQEKISGLISTGVIGPLGYILPAQRIPTNKLSRMRATTSEGSVRPASTMGTVQPASTTVSIRPASTTGSVRPASTTGSVRPASTTGSVRPASTTGSVRPASTTGSVRPASTTGSVRPASTTGSEESDSTTGSIRPVQQQDPKDQPKRTDFIRTASTTESLRREQPQQQDPYDKHNRIRRTNLNNRNSTTSLITGSEPSAQQHRQQDPYDQPPQQETPTQATSRGPPLLDADDDIDGEDNHEDDEGRVVSTEVMKRLHDRSCQSLRRPPVTFDFDTISQSRSHSVSEISKDNRSRCYYDLDDNHIPVSPSHRRRNTTRGLRKFFRKFKKH